MAANNNLKRNEVEAWLETNIWDTIDQAVHDEVERIRVLAKVFVPRPMPNATSVPADEVKLTNMTIGDGTQPFLEISRIFSLTTNQVGEEPKLGTAAILARLSATAVVVGEEILLFQGQKPADPTPLPPGVSVLRRESARDGLLGAALEELEVKKPQQNPAGQYEEATFGAVVEGRNRLLAQGQPGPYALFLEPALFADTYRPLRNTLQTPADRIKPLVPGIPGSVHGGFHASVGLPPNRGLLVSLGGEPTCLVVSQPTVTAHTQQDAEEGLYRFRVSERIQFIARDRRALLRLKFV